VHYSPRQMTVIALVATATAAGGFLLYMALPIPGLKFALLAPLLSLMVALPMLIVRQRGTLLATCVVLAAVMGLFNFLMSMAIVLAGLVTEALAWLLFRERNTARGLRITAATFPTISLIVAALLTHYVTGRLFLGLTWPAIAIIGIGTQILGATGAWVADHVLLPRIILARQRFERE